MPPPSKPRLQIDQLGIEIRAPLEGLRRDLEEANRLLDKFGGRTGRPGLPGGGRPGPGGGGGRGIGGGGFRGAASAAGAGIGLLAGVNQVIAAGSSINALQGPRVGGLDSAVQELGRGSTFDPLINFLARKLSPEGSADRLLAESEFAEGVLDPAKTDLEGRIKGFRVRGTQNPLGRLNLQQEFARSALKRDVRKAKSLAAGIRDRGIAGPNQFDDLAAQLQTEGAAALDFEFEQKRRRGFFKPEGVSTAIGGFNVAPAISFREVVDVDVVTEFGAQ